jgi:DNA-binding MarR family transcriptional regulator
MAEDDPVAAWRAVLLVQDRVVRAIERDLDRAGLIPLTWYDVLLELANAPRGCLRMQGLGARVVLSRTRVSRLVTELEAAGFVERCPDPADGRATLATITRTGREAFRRAAPVYLAGIDQHFNRHLTAVQRRTVADVLQRVLDAHEPLLDIRR